MKGMDVKASRKGAWAGLMLAATLHAGAAMAWEHYPGFRDPGAAGIAIGDFDGDGHREVIATGNSEAGTFFATLDANSSSPGVRVISMLPVGVIGQVLKAPPEDGADRLAALAFQDWWGTLPNQIVILGGVPLRALRTIDAPSVRRITAVADVDGDGRLEIVGMASVAAWSSEYYPIVLDYESGAVKWTGSEKVDGIGVAQLDDDPALELILVGTRGTPGRIIDGASHALKWSYPAGFAGIVLSGRFFSDPTVRGFALAYDRRVQVFRSQPYSPVSEFETDVIGSAVVAQLVPGGPDHVAVGTAHLGRVDMFDPRTGARVLSVSDQDPSRAGVTAIAVGDLAGDGRNKIVFNAGMGHTGEQQLRVVDLATQATGYVQDDEVGPYSAVSLGDIAANGGSQVAYVTRNSVGPFNGQVLRILNGADGRRLRERTLRTSDGYSHIALAQLDNDPQLEIVVVSGSYSEIVVLDGVTLAEQWRLASAQLGYAPLSDLAMIDVNGDGFDDVVVGVGAGQVRVFNGRNGALLWQSATLSGGAAPVLAAFRSETGKPSVVVARGKELHVLDLASRIVVAHASTANGVIGLSRWGEGSACRVGALDEYVVTIRRCKDLSVEGVRAMPWNTEFFRPLDAQATRFVAAAATRLYEVGPDGQAVAMSGPLGARLGTGNMGIVRAEPDGQHFDVTIGSDYMVTRVRVGLDAMFANGFD